MVFLVALNDFVGGGDGGVDHRCSGDGKTRFKDGGRVDGMCFAVAASTAAACFGTGMIVVVVTVLHVMVGGSCRMMGQ